MARLLKEAEVLARVGMGRTKFYQEFVQTGRFRWVYIGPHSKRGLESEVDQLIADLAQQRTLPLNGRKVGRRV
jgi:predicted DNA-binding transcriptional regulator AlpA